MSVERKYGHCQTWNIDRGYCSKCGEIISAELKSKIEFEKKEEEIRTKRVILKAIHLLPRAILFCRRNFHHRVSVEMNSWCSFTL